MLGSTGGLGKAIVLELQKRGGGVRAFSRAQIDLSEKTLALDGAFGGVTPEAVINCAAFTDVELAEVEYFTAQQVNDCAVEQLSKYCESHRIPLIHFSTDYVFSGDLEGPPGTEDTPHPLNTYGLTKLRGEQHVLNFELGAVIRTSWLYSSENNTFPNKIIGKLKEGRPFHVTDDEYGSPTWVRHLAEYTVKLLDSKRTGLFHGSNEGTVSRFEFALRIAKSLGYEIELLKRGSHRVGQGLAARPKLAGLKNTEVEGWVWQSWESAWREAAQGFVSKH